MNFPRIGAFEVFMRKETLFSKLNGKKWPNVDKLVERICNVIEINPYKSITPEPSMPKLIKVKKLKKKSPKPRTKR